MTPAGKRDTPVRIEQKSIARNGIGEEVVSWVEFKTRLGSVQPIRGREFFAAAQSQSSVDYRVRLLKPLALTRDMRIVTKGKTMDIVECIEHDDEFELMCSTGVRNAI
jgi:SPP1 family predicted phage head-tail adaptor